MPVWEIEVSESEEIVAALAKLDGKRILQFQDPSPEAARVRVGKPSKKLLRERMLKHAARDK